MAAFFRPSALERRLMDTYQRDLPLTPRPFAAMAERTGASEDDVLAALKRLDAAGATSRVGAVVEPGRAGASTLAALAVPAERLDEVAALVNEYAEVNHNYEREHRYNLWFVLTAPSRARLDEVLAEIAARTGLAPLDLPMERAYRLDLAFPLQWT